MRTAFAIVFLLLQLGSVIYARFTPRRYFCWAPNDYVVEYHVDVTVHGRPLTPQEVVARYHSSPEYEGRVEYPAEHLIDNIEQYEETYGRNDHAEVRLTWKYNGHPELRHWKWPR
jgi:hypothetical protein